ncbi:MAG: DNA mismatch repair protein MutS [Methyloprofundus sp.]|nr:DNA mismatch repair protein MutS [Methyloprofundus sp.]
MTLLKAWNGQWPDIRVSKPAKTSDKGVLDSGAFRSIEVDKLFDTVNHAQTIIGQAVLYRSLVQPLDDLQSIVDKQEAIKEIQSNHELKASLEQLVSNAKQDEIYFQKLLFGNFLGSTGTARDDSEIEGYGYVQYRRGTRFIRDFVDGTDRINAVKSNYLGDVLQSVKDFSATRAYALMSGPAYITEKGVQSKIDRSKLSPAIIFNPQIFKPLLFIMMFAVLLAGKFFLPADIINISRGGVAGAAIFLIPMMLIYIPIVGGFDRDSCIKPLREEYKSSADVGLVLDAIGRVDELLSLAKYAGSCAEALVMPELIDAQHHKISLQNAKNPVLSKANAAYVGNDFNIDQEKLVLITGPNSGGKTAFCKTVTQIQLLAQIGSYVPATSAILTVADKIFYQAPEISQLEDGEGRFGTELKRTRDIFLAASEKSLVVLDELSEGTTFEEKMETSANVLDGFYQKGCNVLLITHNHQLVDHFINQRMGVALQVEFIDEDPTHKLIPGISRVSHAHRVAKKIGFSKGDIARHLADG